MHIHGQMNMNAANLYAAAEAEKAAETRRAAEVRKRLLKSAQSMDGEPSAEETFMISRWLGQGPHQSPDQDGYRPSGRDTDFD